MYLLEPPIEIWLCFLIFFRILAIENPPKNLILAFLICSTTFWLYMANKKEAGTDGVLPYMEEGPNICM